MARHLDSRLRTTPRFTLRPFRRRDVVALHEAVLSSQKELQPWLPWANSYDRSVAQRFVRDSAAAWAEGKAFDRDQMDALLALADGGLKKLFAIQDEILAGGATE